MNMAFSEDQKATIREIAWEVGKAICSEIREDRAKDIRLHQNDCPVVQKFTRYESRFSGFCAGFALVGSVVGAALVFLAKYAWTELTRHNP